METLQGGMQTLGTAPAAEGNPDPNWNPENLPPGAIQELDTLDLTNVDTNRPLIPDGKSCGVVFKSIEVKDNKEKTGKVATFKFTTTETVTATNGKVLNPGFTHTERVSLAPTDKYDPNERLARIQECFLGVKGKWVTNDIVNREGIVRFGVETSLEYGSQNRIVSWTKKKVDAPTLA